MNLVFLSDKVCWADATSPTGYSTVGGFPFQMRAIAGLFDSTRIVILELRQPAPPNLMHLTGPNLSVHPIRVPGVGRPMGWLLNLPWVVRSLLSVWRDIKQADAVHVAVPGMGLLAILMAGLQRKNLFIRHCGTWDQPVTFSNHLLLWILERIAGDQTIVLATGGAETPPSARNPRIRWIFSTSLTRSELESITPAAPWTGGKLRLVTVGRVTAGKNMFAIIQALPEIGNIHPQVHLDVIGDGEHLQVLEDHAQALGLQGRVTFHGNLNHDQVLAQLAQAHLFVFPTRTKEGFPKALLEALACGLPAIATRVSVIPKLLQNGCGLLLDEPDATSVAHAVLEVTSVPGRLEEMGRLAREAAQGYTLEAWAAQIGEHLEQAWGPLKAGSE